MSGLDFRAAMTPTEPSKTTTTAIRAAVRMTYRSKRNEATDATRVCARALGTSHARA